MCLLSEYLVSAENVLVLFRVLGKQERQDNEEPSTDTAHVYGRRQTNTINTTRKRAVSTFIHSINSLNANALPGNTLSGNSLPAKCAT